jgi:signal transduction histidine kinase
VLHALAEVPRSLVRASTYLRWVYLLLGSALVLAFILVDSMLVALVFDLGAPTVLEVALAAAMVVVPPFLLGALPAVREVEGIAVQSLLGVTFDERPLGPAKTWPQRRRTAGWFLLHLVGGIVIGVATTLAVPFGLLLAIAPLRGAGPRNLLPGAPIEVTGTWTDLWMPAAGLLGLALPFLLSAALGALLARWAPQVLGLTPSERIELLERRTATLAERNRLARDLHDSVGHALSLVTLQAGAARRVLDTDPEFARTALEAMETSARTALADLDHVLGLLREDRRDGRVTPQATLQDVGRLVEASRAGGVEISVSTEGDLAGVPAAVSREAYRIVQEGITNAIRHAGSAAVDVRIEQDTDELRLEVVNPVARTTGRAPTGGGRGLAGIRERVAVLRGTVEAGLVDDRWRLAVTIPVATLK